VQLRSDFEKDRPPESVLRLDEQFAADSVGSVELQAVRTVLRNLPTSSFRRCGPTGPHIFRIPDRK